MDSILATEPANPRALTMGAQLARFGGDDKARRSYLDRALAAAPADAAVLVAWGDLYLDAKDWPKADDFYRRALARPEELRRVIRAWVGLSIARPSTRNRKPP